MGVGLRRQISGSDLEVRFPGKGSEWGFGVSVWSFVVRVNTPG